MKTKPVRECTRGGTHSVRVGAGGVASLGEVYLDDDPPRLDQLIQGPINPLRQKIRYHEVPLRPDPALPDHDSRRQNSE